MANKNDKLVVAYYENIPTAYGAAQNMMEWDEANDDIKLGAVAVMSYDPRTDALKAEEIGARKTTKGALWGTAIGATLGILTGGIALIPGLVIGAGTGAVLGHADHREVVMTQGEAAGMLERLRHGAGAVAVMADDFEVEATRLFLAKLGGDVDDFTLPEETAAAVTAAAAAQSAATTAVEEALAASKSEAPPQETAVAASLAGVAELSADDAARLHGAGLEKASDLLAQGATPEGRAELAGATGVSEATILAAVRQMDLMRVSGIGVTYSRLLLAAGLESVPDLARRNPANLRLKLADVNAQTSVAEHVPSEETLAGWIAAALGLPPIISY